MALAFMDEIETDAESTFAVLFHDRHLFNSDWYEVFLFVAQMLLPEKGEIFLQRFKAKLMAYLQEQNSSALAQVEVGGAIATRIIHLYKTHVDSPTIARDRLDQYPLASALTMSAFCSDYYYRFDPARRISRVFEVGYQFNHDLVLAHCFKCNLHASQKQELKYGQHFNFADALVHVWHQTELHQANQRLETIDQVRALFFDYVLQHPDRFSQTCQQRLQGEVPRLKQVAKLSTYQESLEKSKLVAEVSQPDQEKHPFLDSEQYRFPVRAYDDAEAFITLSHYYYGCTLLCHCLTSAPGPLLQAQFLPGLFLVAP